MEYWNLYAQQNGQLDVIPNGPRYGLLIITDVVHEEVRPETLRKCQVTFYDDEAIEQWGEERTFWIAEREEQAQRRETALAHLNGQQ